MSVSLSPTGRTAIPATYVVLIPDAPAPPPSTSGSERFRTAAPTDRKLDGLYIAPRSQVPVFFLSPNCGRNQR